MPVEIGGRLYNTVAERLKVAHGDEPPPKGIQRIETNTEAVGTLTVIHARVVFQDGRAFDGTSLVNLQATGRAERDAPLETAETSAVGRALAMAGYPGNDEGLAGAEEMHLAQQRAAARTPQFADGSSPVTRMSSPASGAAPRPAGNPGGPSPSQVRYLNSLWEQAGRPFPPPDAPTMTSRDVSRVIDELKAELGIPSNRPAENR